MPNIPNSQDYACVPEAASNRAASADAIAPISAELEAADAATAQGRIYRPGATSAQTDGSGSDAAVRDALAAYLASRSADDLAAARERLVAVQQAGVSGYYTAPQVQGAIDTIDAEIAGYRRRGL